MAEKSKAEQDLHQRIGGHDLTRDGSGRIVYTNRLLKRSFFLPENRLQGYSNISARYGVALAVGILLWVFTQNVPFAIISGVVIGVALTAWFYYGFLTSLDVAPDAPVDRRQSPFSFVMGSQPVASRVLRGVLCIALGLLLLLNMQQQQFAGTEHAINLVLVVAALVYGAFELVTLVIGLALSRRDR
ncbi:MAG: hypothetical protein LKI25_00340 [Atopobiaceae bacterium]|jgi:uncharacterized membrane-anchored protein YitT (DUF2179 family)|nr:hypothetical protein [Atopobiaceae bacterium]MCI2172660.1 hypothetical protein [Atopobiaceae bacterium]MCI2206967.1 hypothetical protein [Atopobiaceae bacterium]